MALLRRYLRREAAALARDGVRLQVLGRRDRLSPGVLEAIAEAEATTRQGRTLLLRLCVDYSGRDSLVAGFNRLMQNRNPGEGPATRDDLEAAMLSALGGDRGGAPDPGPVDLLIRTGGEQRISDFLIWECAYAEFLFLPVFWPDFTALSLAGALKEFERRDRRFGGLPPLATPA
jgi:undecaprenyl diphosphate synthase